MTEEEKKAIDLLKFYEGFFKNIGHEEEVKSIESVINCIEKLKKENEELKNKVAKRNNELIELEETSEKEFLTKQEVKENYIPKSEIREKIRDIMIDVVEELLEEE